MQFSDCSESDPAYQYNHDTHLQHYKYKTYESDQTFFLILPIIIYYLALIIACSLKSNVGKVDIYDYLHGINKLFACFLFLY